MPASEHPPRSLQELILKSKFQILRFQRSSSWSHTSKQAEQTSSCCLWRGDYELIPGSFGGCAGLPYTTERLVVATKWPASPMFKAGLCGSRG